MSLVETHFLVGIADLRVFQFQERRVAEPVGRGNRVVAVFHDAQPRIQYEDYNGGIFRLCKSFRAE